MARWVIAVMATAIALAAAGCGSRACERWPGAYDQAYCVEYPVLLPWDQCVEDCQCWETCEGLGYTQRCTFSDGSTYWKLPGRACLEPLGWPP
ncbi:MAG TPA: hypothetical protein VFR85_03430 [Anaeromyxobacteraceae bacterium]|nr:hypothetical protein [Anaeromyxobacteraceae bacterium]